jgi:pimeloyl-ACP methyl ester carboxylesterase
MDVILIPGLWLDGASWDEVVPALESAGLRAHPLTLPGMESKDADRSGITLRDHVEAVVKTIDSVDPDAPLALVGHSGGGAIAHAAADARPDRIARLIYVDTWPLGDGGCVNDEYPAENGEVPLPDWSAFEAEDLVGLDDAGRAAFRERAIPSPVHVARDPQRLYDVRRFAIPSTVIACEFTGPELVGWIASGHPALAEVAKVRDLAYVELPTGHWPQFTRPRDLAEAIRTILAVSTLGTANRPADQ